MTYKLFIPSAGVGSRLGSHTKLMNKALITIGDLPAIANIIKRFPKDIKVVVALGYCADHLRQTLDMVCDDYDITYVEVSPYVGQGSSLGHTILACEEHLQCPFIFVPNDTIVDFQLPKYSPMNKGNWCGYYQKVSGDGVPIDQYRTIEIANGQVPTFHNKGANKNNIYVGVAGVRDYDLFWQAMNNNKNYSVGEVIGLSHLPELQAVEFPEWQDLGNIRSLNAAISKFKNLTHNILPKENEAIWFADGAVYKYHTDESFIENRVKRLKHLPPKLFPHILKSTKNIYKYEKIEGEVLSKCITPKLATSLLDQANERLWSNRSNNIKELNLHYFYREKTYERLEHYYARFERIDRAISINGEEIPAASDMMSSINWEKFLSNSVISKFHGDFHPENIIVTPNGEFKLIDWRQDFSGDLEWGDAYYDLGKFLHGLIVSHEQVARNNFSISYHDASSVHIDISVPLTNLQTLHAFKEWCSENDYNFSHIYLISGIIYLNIAGLHDEPYSDFLYFLGLQTIFNYIKNSQL